MIAPLSTITNWQREFEAWSDFNIIVYHGRYERSTMLFILCCCHCCCCCLLVYCYLFNSLLIKINIGKRTGHSDLLLNNLKTEDILYSTS